MIKDSLRFLFSSTVSVLLALKFVLLASLPMRFFRLNYGRAVYYSISFAFFFFLLGMNKIEWSITYLTLILLVGVYSELEQARPKKLVINSAVSMSAALGTALGCLGLWAYKSGLSLVPFLAMKYTVFVEPIFELPQFTDLNFDVQSLFWFFPSGLGILYMFALFICLSVFRDPQGKIAPLNLKNFELPEPCVWAFIFSLAGSFLLAPLGPVHIVAANSLLLLLGAFFFQGLAVIVTLMDNYRVHGVWRFVLLFLIFFQGLIFVSIVGLIDFWADFRKFSRGQAKNFPRGQE